MPVGDRALEATTGMLDRNVGVKKRALSAAGRVARWVPADQVQLFAFLASPAVRSDPWALYRRLHDRRGGVLAGPYGIWLVASHAVATEVLRSRDVSVKEELATGLPQRSGKVETPFERLMDRTLLFTDPPDHARLRRLVSVAFTPRRVEELRPRVEAMVDERLGALRPAGRADLLADLALPLPVAVICELLGVLEGDRPRFLAWARHLAPRLDVSLFRDEERERRADEAAIGIEAFLGELIDDPGRRGEDGLLAALTEVEGLAKDEIVALCGLLLVAGFETTMNLIGNGTLALLRDPEQLARVRDGNVEPSTVVEELLRAESPVQLTQRVALAELDLGGHVVPAGTLVAVLVGAANRDPAVFDDPDRLDVGRDPNPHLSFSHGIHHCLGAALARLEASVAVPAIARSLPNLRLAATPRWRDTFVLRGLTSLPVVWG